MRTSVLIAVLILIPMSYADAQIPQVERDALIALCNSTDGANWSRNFGWLVIEGSECAWHGVDCYINWPDEYHVEVLYLDTNQLSGSIPAELGNLSNLKWLYLHTNQLSGSIPPELGNLSSLTFMRLYSNQLSGSIPAELEDLSALWDDKSDLRWNALHSENVTLIEFLNIKQKGGDWQSTQTIAPVNLTVDSVGDHTTWLTWDAVSYQSNRGGYEVFSAPTGTGAWTSGG